MPPHSILTFSSIARLSSTLSSLLCNALLRFFAFHKYTIDYLNNGGLPLFRPMAPGWNIQERSGKLPCTHARPVWASAASTSYELLCSTIRRHSTSDLSVGVRSKIQKCQKLFRTFHARAKTWRIHIVG